jgi:alpha-beta hydrolase superfamily lysophospholipase
MGHSYGALVLAAHMIAHCPSVAGLVFTSPLMKLSDDVSKLLQVAARVLSILTPWLPVAQVEIDGVSRDPEFLAVAGDDPLCYYGKVLARTGAEMARATKQVQRGMGSLVAPMIICHGTEDRLANPDGSRLLYERAGSRDKTMKWYEGAYHELFNDLDREQFYADMIEWLDAHR